MCVSSLVHISDGCVSHLMSFIVWKLS